MWITYGNGVDGIKEKEVTEALSIFYLELKKENFRSCLLIFWSFEYKNI